MMIRYVKYLTRPLCITAAREAKEAGIPDSHEHPHWKTLPKGEKFPVLFMHVFQSEYMPWTRIQVLCPSRGLAWWMDITHHRSKQLPKMEAHVHAYRF